MEIKITPKAQEFIKAKGSPLELKTGCSLKPLISMGEPYCKYLYDCYKINDIIIYYEKRLPKYKSLLIDLRQGKVWSCLTVKVVARK